MLDVPAPSAPFYHDPITLDELIQTLKKVCCGSSPNPFDGSPYTIPKRCPSLHPALMHLYNTCLMISHAPAMWRKAVISLISKSSAQTCSSNPKNFSPITLTSCINNESTEDEATTILITPNYTWHYIMHYVTVQFKRTTSCCSVACSSM